jgi:hypothetical protein
MEGACGLNNRFGEIARVCGLVGDFPLFGVVLVTLIVGDPCQMNL